MRRLLLIGLIALPLWGKTGGMFGIGVVMGDPTAITSKYWISHYNAWDLAVSWKRGEWRNILHLHSTYLYHFYGLIPDPHFSFYLGMGARMETRDERSSEKALALGPRFTGGADFFYFPIEIFFEVAPTLNFIPELEPDIEFGLGLRFYFQVRR